MSYREDVDAYVVSLGVEAFRNLDGSVLPYDVLTVDNGLRRSVAALLKPFDCPNYVSDHGEVHDALLDVAQQLESSDTDVVDEALLTAAVIWSIVVRRWLQHHSSEGTATALGDIITKLRLKFGLACLADAAELMKLAWTLGYIEVQALPLNLPVHEN